MSKIVRFKCPYCDKRFERANLVRHVEDHHSDMIPEGYTPLRVVFNYVNKKPLDYNGICTECKGPTMWRENKGRYDRQCQNPACKASYLKNFEQNMVRTMGVTRISSTAAGQEKMLANRKISGKYKFKDGSEKTYTGSYELKALEFMDKVMDIQPEDIMCPGPILEYTYKGKKHLYITDFYYVPYDLIIEVKDGGNRPNKRDMPDYRGKQIAKEEYIVKNTKYNYLRLTDNDLSQLLAVFMDLKMQLVDQSYDRVIHINEAEVLNEGYIKNEKDIYYNKDKFDSGEINLCFITGLSGSGKSTMGRNLSSKNVEHYELDDVVNNKAFSMDNFKEYGDLIYSFFNGSGKKYYNLETYPSNYMESVIEDFIKYSIQYSKSHKNIKFVLDGIWVFMYISPEELKDYAVYIKGTSGITSMIRAAKRDFGEEFEGKGNKFLHTIKRVSKDISTLPDFENRLSKYRNYFSKLENKKINEAMNALMTGYIPAFNSDGSVYVVNYIQNNVFSGEQEFGYAVSDNPKLTNLICRNKAGVLSRTNESLLERCEYSVYRVNISSKELSEKLAPYMEQFVSESFLYETIFGKKLYSRDQIEFEEKALPVIDYYKSLDLLSETVKNYIKGVKTSDLLTVQNENSLMSVDCSDNDNRDKSCVTYFSIKEGKYILESVDFPDLKLTSDKFMGNTSDESKFLTLLSYRKGE